MFSKILVPLDMSKPEMSARLCEHAANLAKVSSASIELVTVIPDYGMTMVASYFPEDAQKNLKAEVKEKMATYASSIESGNVSVSISSGKRTQSILRHVEASKPDLVIIGTRRKKSHGGRRLLGSCSQSVTDRAECSVLVVR